ncbi:hypothetical protein ABB37_02509 [Leptomonas pyrrhocoris]|uniref:C-CAP/cofactor C-like domain-containing protein n=1 Tax=Leptomonas pyrrhocoris TaxID=157538 RepID=A0A0M9G5N8_LEPPY|nr:hypothetical protein ABB37_02509 [Leptomonas pyrrhocoris]KPA82686.1 hypothetical protein ABB37_02509 [Leptomonas pyrrhocoris]|eukprot:XP_015661125.1 hypothetical protein ABB37_02509 [Leptomonas pyrrhocoris]
MQFSDSESSESSAEPTPVKRLRKALPQRLSGNGPDASGGLESTVRAFTRTASPDTSARRAEGDGERGDGGDGTHRGSSLHISITAGTQGSPMTTATRARAVISVSDDEDDSDDSDGAAADINKRGGMRASQRVPPFFAKKLSTPSDAAGAAAATASATPAGESAQTALRLAQSSSSSVSSLSLELSGVHRAAPKPHATEAGYNPPQSRRAAVLSTSSSSLDSSRASSPPVVVDAVAARRPDPRRSSSSSSSASSPAELVFHRLSFPHSTAAAHPASPVSSTPALPPGEVPRTSKPTTTATSEASAVLRPRVVSPAERNVHHGAAVVSDFDEGVDEDALDSSAASLTVQAALDAAEQRQLQQDQGETPPAVSATTLHPLSTTQSQVGTPLPTSQRSPMQVHVERAEGEEEEAMTMPEDVPRRTAAGRHDAHLDDADDATVESVIAGSQQLPYDTAEVVEGTATNTAAGTFSSIVTGPRRQPPPPPPALSTTTTMTRPSPSAMRPDDDDDDDDGVAVGECEEEEHILSKADTELTVEQQNAPATYDTSTHVTSTEAPQAAVMHSTSFPLPTRSSSSGGGSTHSHKGGAQGGQKKRPRAEQGTASSNSSSSDADTAVLSPPQTALEQSGTLEEDDGGTMRSVVAIGSGGGDGVTAAAPVVWETPTALDLKHQHFLHLPSVHGETQTAPLPTTATTGDESPSRLSGVLMPPSPSQPRVCLSPYATSLNSSNASSAKANLHTGAAAGALPPPPPTPPHLSSGGAAGNDNDRQTSRVESGAGVMRMAPAPSSSSSSPSSSRSDSSRIHEGADLIHQAARSKHDRNEAADGGNRNAAVDHKPGTRAMPVLTSGDDDDDGDLISDNKDVRSGAAPFVRSSSLHSPTSSSAEAQSAPESAQVEEALREYKFGGVGAATADVRAAAQAQRNAMYDTEAGEDEFEEGEEGDAWEDSDGAARSSAEVDSPHELQEAGRWSEVLKDMELIDCTMVSQVYQQTLRRRSRESHSAAEENEESGEDVCLFKVLSLFPLVASDERARWSRRTEVQRRLLDLAQEMRNTQRALDEAGLTAAGVERSASVSLVSSHSDNARPTRATCAGISAVYVDANCRLIAQLEAEPYMIPLRHLLPAACGTGLQENEIVALLRSVVCKTAVMHNAGFVHGALHSGNVLLSSYDGDTVLTQPCGLMSQSWSLPSDLSVLSVARACAMAAHLPRVWGARRLHVKAQTSARLGTPSRPDINELVTYHNMAILGWDRDDSDAEDGDARGNRGNPAAYSPTTADDLYALGLIAFLLYLGVPPFHTTSLWAAVERLGVLAGDYEAAMKSSSRHAARYHIAAFCFGERDARRSDSAAAKQLPDLFTCGYGNVQRHAVGRLRPEFEEALQNFIVDCVEASCVEAVRNGGGANSHRISEDASGNTRKNSRSCGPHYRTAQDLLDTHALFQRFGVAGASEAVEEGEEGEEDNTAETQMRDTVHRLVYPAFCTWARARAECGSAPHLARMHSNALYTARCMALCESLHAVNAAEHPPDPSAPAATTVLSVLCPEVAGSLQAWQPWFPSVGTSADGLHCVYGVPAGKGIATGAEDEDDAHTHGAQPRASTRKSATAVLEGRSNVSSFIRPSGGEAPAWRTDAHDTDENALSDDAEDALARQLLCCSSPSTSYCEFRHYPHLHALVLANKQSDSFGLSRAFVLSRLSDVADTLVLQQLRDCTITLLAPFRYVVLDGVVRCEVRLGPCEACVLRDVRDCPVIAVAAHHICGAEVHNTQISWAGCSDQDDGAPPLKDSRNVSFSLYGLVYGGLVEDYKRVGLPLEHAAALRTLEGRVNGSGAQGDEQHTGDGVHRRMFELSATTANVGTRDEVGLCLTPEAPYAHALLASGTRYVHRGSPAISSTETANRRQQHQEEQAESDVYHFFGELHEKDVLVCDVHGSKEGELPNGEVSRPVVFLHGILGDATVERCSFCTVVVTGTPGSLQVVDCHHCQLIVMARECVLERCTQVDCVALVTEYLLAKSCEAVRVRPLFLDCPFSDEVLQRVVMGSLGGQEEETVIAAYEDGRFDLLNAVLRGVGQGVNVEESKLVVVEDMHYYSHGKYKSGDDHDTQDEDGGSERWFSVFTVPYSAVHCRVLREGGGREATPSDASEVMAAAAQALAEHLSLPAYTEVLQRYEDASDASPSAEQRHVQHTVAFHDLLDCSVLRLRGAVCPVRMAERVAAEAAGEDLTARAPTLSDVCVLRVQFGVLYIEDAVNTLRLSHCVGPLDVVVCAATTVVMERCIGVQLRTACVDFRATDCAGCHVALHVNNAPQYQRCTSMETSVLNITASGFDALLAAAEVDASSNRFNAPLLLTQSWETTQTVKAPTPALTAAAVHAYCTGTVAAVPESQTTTSLCEELLAFLARPEGASRGRAPPAETPVIMALLRQPVTVVSPLPGLCVSPREVPFVEELEMQVARWSQRRAPACRNNVVDVALRALADVSSVYLDVPAWTAAAAGAAEASAQKPPTVTGVSTAEEEATPVVHKDVARPAPAEIEEPPQQEQNGRREVGEGEAAADQPAATVVSVPLVRAAVAAKERSAVVLASASDRQDIIDGEEGDGAEEIANEEEEEDVQPNAEAPQLEAPPLQVATTDPTSQMARGLSDAAAVVAASSPSLLVEKREEEPHAEIATAAITVAAAASEVHRDPAAGLNVATHASPRTSVGSFAPPPRYSEPLSSHSPVASSPDPSATVRTMTSEHDDYSNCANALCATTTTIPAPSVDESGDSSVGTPPLAPLPAYALSATDVGASSTMEIFNPTYQRAVAATAMRLFDEADAPARHAAVTGGYRPVHGIDSPSGQQPTLVNASPVITAALTAARGGVPPLVTTVNRFKRSSEEDWVHSPPVDTPSRHRDDDHEDSRRHGGGSGAVEDRQPTANAAAMAAATATEAAAFLTAIPAPVQGEREDVMGFSSQTSSSVPYYPHRGVPACDDNTPRVAGLEENDLGRPAGAPRQTTNFLHFSEDSSSRRGDSSHVPSHVAVSGTSPPVSPGEHRIPDSDSFGVPAVDAGMRELLRQVDEARQRYARRQQQQPQRQGGRPSEALRARVKSAVAKVQSVRAPAEVAEEFTC